MSTPKPNASLFSGQPPEPAIYPSLRGQIALVTGIGQVGDQSKWGNGAAMAMVLVQNGVKIFGCDLKLEAAQHNQKRLQAMGGECEVMAADATKAEDVKKLVDACMEKYGRIDILINNVGMSMPGDPASMTESVWDSQMEVNLKSVYLTCHHVLPIMEKQASGSIINIASIAALRYIGKAQVAYSATKAAIISFTRVTAVIYAPKGVRLNVVVPGLIHTPLVRILAQKYNNGDEEGLVKKRDNAVPMGKMGESWDTANAAVFLCSEQARYITGQELVVDGGITSSVGWESG